MPKNYINIPKGKTLRTRSGVYQFDGPKSIEIKHAKKFNKTYTDGSELEISDVRIEDQVKKEEKKDSKVTKKTEVKVKDEPSNDELLQTEGMLPQSEPSETSSKEDKGS